MMTFSEFGRRPEENGDGGTDHGTAAPHFVIGDHVNGGLHGTQPSLTHLDPDGNFVPSVDFHQMYAPILKTWLGVDDRAVLGRSYAPLALFKTGPGVVVAPPVGKPPVAPAAGYWLAGPSGHVYGLGSSTKFGSLASVGFPLVAGASTPTHRGLWLAGTDGGVFSFGDAQFHGSTGAMRLNRPIVAMAPTLSGRGYWLCASDGGIFAFGDAQFHGSTGAMRLNKPVVAMAATPTGQRLLALRERRRHLRLRRRPVPRIDRRDATQQTDRRHGRHPDRPAATGSARATAASSPSATPQFHGATLPTSAAVCGFARSGSGKGYWMAAADGTVGAFGDAAVLGGVKDIISVFVS